MSRLPNRDELVPSVRSLPRPRDGVVPKKPLDLTRFGSLQALQEDYVLFSPAAMYVRGRFPDARWADLAETAGGGFVIGFGRLARPLFAGLEDSAGRSDWNHALFVVPRRHWRTVEDFVCSLTIVDSVAGLACAYPVQDVTVIDEVALARSVVVDRIPTVTLPAFGVRRTDATWAFLGRPPTLSRLAPDARMADLLSGFRRDTNPLEFAAAEAFRRTIAAAREAGRPTGGSHEGRTHPR